MRSVAGRSPRRLPRTTALSGGARPTGRRLAIAGLAGALVGLATATVGGQRAAADTTPNPLSFGTPTVVDNHYEGFEPDLAVDQRTGQIYSSIPYGSAQGDSYIWRSDDGGASFHVVEGNALGKPATCVGGGDTELKVDPVNSALYFSDLQSGPSFANSTSADAGHTWSTSCYSATGFSVDRQWLAQDSNGGTSAVGSAIGTGPAAGRLYFEYDNVNQNTTAANAGSNQLVINGSDDGTQFGRCLNQASVPCTGVPTVISTSESLPGNMVVDDNPQSPYFHSVYVIHGDASGSGVLVSYCRNQTGDTAAIAAARCTDPTKVKGAGHVSTQWADANVRAPDPSNLDSTLQNFPVVTVDSGGRLYAVWSEYPQDANLNINGPGVIRFSSSSDGGVTWSTAITLNATDLHNNVFPWIVSGDAGRVAVVWYGAEQAPPAPPSGTVKSLTGLSGPSASNDATWNLYAAESLDAGSATPHFTTTQVSDHAMKYGAISTGGLTGTADRSLGDFMQVQRGPRGEIMIAYVDDTSNTPTDSNGGVGAGPVMFVRQTGGPSLLASVGDLGPAPANPVNQVAVTPGSVNAFYSALGSDKPAPTHLQLTGATVSLHGTSLVVTLTTSDPNLGSDLGPDPTLGGDTEDWLVRFASRAPGQTDNGNLFYLGMESVRGGPPTFFDGSTTQPSQYPAPSFGYPQTTTVPSAPAGTAGADQAVINGSTITWTVPLADFHGVTATSTLYSVTGFTSTQVGATTTNGTTGGGSAAIPNTIMSTPAFTAILSPAADIPELPGLPPAVALGALVAVLVGATGRRRRCPTAG